MSRTKLDKLEALVIKAPPIGPYAAAISRPTVLALITCVRAANAMRDPALVGNRDRVAEYDSAYASLEKLI